MGLNKLFPINLGLMFRSILGRVEEGANWYRGVRVTFVTGTIVGVPDVPTRNEALTSLVASALAFGADGEPVIRGFLSPASEVVAAFDPERSNRKSIEYVGEAFVWVRKDTIDEDVDLDEYPAGTHPDDVVCFNIIEVDPYSGS